jgi:hypothetical protein
MLSFSCRVAALAALLLLSSAPASSQDAAPPAPAPAATAEPAPSPTSVPDSQPAAPQGEPAAVGEAAAPAVSPEGPPRAPQTLDAASLRPECRWTGQRIVSLLWRDDISTALQHLQVYNTFGCSSEQLRVVFACLIRQGDFDPQGTPALAVRILSCWTNPVAGAAGVTP